MTTLIDEIAQLAGYESTNLHIWNISFIQNHWIDIIICLLIGFLIGRAMGSKDTRYCIEDEREKD